MLSFLHQLNAVGYGISFGIGIAAFFYWKSKNGAQFPRINLKRLRRRFRRGLPLVFFVLTALEITGGVLYAPTNYDALVYRLPRILNWLSREHWFWIAGDNDRLNYPTVAWEWLATPFFALLHSDRALFLINASGYLLMPSLLFAVLLRTGATRKSAWAWMWILPLGFGFVLQAGGVGNDLLGTVFALASVFFGLRARESKSAGMVWNAIIAAALMTGTKLSNLPLLLPCLVAVWPALKNVRGHYTAGLAVGAIAVLISAAPTMLLNQIHAGSWNGDPRNAAQLQATVPRAALLGNAILVSEQALMPPVLPQAGKVGRWVDEKLPSAWRRLLENGFPRYYFNYLNELPQEEGAGLGLGVTLLMAMSIIGAAAGAGRIRAPWRLLVGISAWVAAIFFMIKMGSEAAARLMLPYYPLALLPILSLSTEERFIRSRIWKCAAMLCILGVAPAILLSPARPLFPAPGTFHRLAQQRPDNAILRRANIVYSAYANRNDVLATVRNALPPDAQKVGFVASSNDTDYSLWRPFGHRVVVRLQSDAQRQVIVPPDIQWVAVKTNFWPEISGESFDVWVSRNHLIVMQTNSIVTLANAGAETWCVVHREK